MCYGAVEQGNCTIHPENAYVNYRCLKFSHFLKKHLTSSFAQSKKMLLVGKSFLNSDLVSSKSCVPRVRDKSIENCRFQSSRKVDRIPKILKTGARFSGNAAC